MKKSDLEITFFWKDFKKIFNEPFLSTAFASRFEKIELSKTFSQIVT
jgi:hypothetical protein